MTDRSPSAAVALDARGVSSERASARSVALRFAAVAALLAADLWTKARVFEWLESYPTGMVRDVHGHLRYPLVDGWLTLMLSWNPGMAWGFDKIPPALLVAGRAAAVLFLAVLIVRTPASRRALVVALVLILGGAMGNLYDNLFLEPRSAGARFGEVRDFIDVYFPPVDWHFPTFNVADSCITVGAIFLLWASLRSPREGARRPAAGGTARPLPGGQELP